MGEWHLNSGRITPAKGPLLTVVMDGVGLGPLDQGNAFYLARTPVLDTLFARYGHLELTAHGTAVGLPSDGDMGNSEVGHNALGAGRVFAQGAKLINTAIASGTIFQGKTWKWLLDGVRESGQPLHFIGLLSDGNVHSHQDHLFAMLRQAAAEGIPQVRIHVLIDGRDVAETSALIYLDRLDQVLGEIGLDYRVASGGGRMQITMDRYAADWPMVEQGWAVHVRGEGRRFESATQAVKTFRAENPGVIDQNLPGFVISDDNGPIGPIRDGAPVVLFNFRGDRAIEITQAFEDEVFNGFERGPRPKVRYAGMMQYDGDLKCPQRFLVEPPTIDHTLGEYLARNGITQFACSETQKFGHVTYFWNGNRSGAFDDTLETYLEIPSDTVPFEQRPWMKAAEIVDATLRALKTGQVRSARINFPNGDMVGHTGDRDAAILAVECLDHALGRLLTGLKKLNGVALVTADHGNCDEMYEHAKDGSFLTRSDGTFRAKTSHTLNQVPLILVDSTGQMPTLSRHAAQSPGLANVAATALELLGFKPPDSFEPSLLA